MKRALAAAMVVAALTLASFFLYPGHTWLQSDTQIYAPILERLWDPAVFEREMLVERPHVSFTIYDEAALALRRLTRLDFATVLAAQQIVFRALGIWGVFLMATALGLTFWPAALVASIFSLGATIAGPSVLLFEYEPVPRGFAVPLLFLALGMVGHGRHLAAGAAASLAFLIHPPTVWPFWAIYFIVALRPGKPDTMRRHIHAVFTLVAATLLLFLASRFQAGVGETQAFFTQLDPLQEKLQRMRSPYVYISIWWVVYWKHYLILIPLTAAALWRIRRAAPADLRLLLIGLPAIGVLSVPLSWLLLEHFKWALTPQVQPMRALLFIAAIALFACAAAGVQAAGRGRWPEVAAWFLAAYLIPPNARLDVLPPSPRLVLTAALATAACVAMWAFKRHHRAGPAAIAAVAAAAFFGFPGYGRAVNYPALRTAELQRLADWARTSTPKSAVFLFPEAGRDLDPGIFRANALRAVYVDWKGGGQVNYLKDLGELWWSRWQAIAPFRPERAGEYRAMGIDYLVLTKSRLPVLPAFDNGKYRVYRLRE
jgi:hypothetical protein